MEKVLLKHFCSFGLKNIQQKEYQIVFQLKILLKSRFCLGAVWTVSICIVKVFCLYVDCSRTTENDIIPVTILTEKNGVLLNSVQEWLVGCFWSFLYVYTIKHKIHYLFKWIQLNGNVKIGWCIFKNLKIFTSSI